MRFLAALTLLVSLASCATSNHDASTSIAVREDVVKDTKVTASSAGPGGGVRTIVDGDLSTGWSAPDAPYWFEVDLGEQIQIDRVRLLAGADTTSVVHVNVGVHDDPGRRPGEFVDGVSGGVWMEVPVGYQARFVRVTVESSERSIIWLELEVVPGRSS